MIISFICILFITALPLRSQVDLEWVACYNGQSNLRDDALGIWVDDSANVYVTGASWTSSQPDYATIKYDKKGNQIWIRRYGQSNVFQVGHAITVDGFGNVYVTGAANTIKYDANGNLLWDVYNQAECKKIIINNPHIYVAGTGFGSYRILKISNDGKIIWQALYSNPTNWLNRLNDMVIDSEENIIVTGDSWLKGSPDQWDYLTVKYTSDGDTLWSRRYNGPSQDVPSDHAFAVTVDNSNNIYVTGWSDGISENAQCFTIAYSPSGDTLWEHRYSGIGYAGYDIIYSNGFIYVAARSNGVEDVLLKYDKDGNLVWTFFYPSNHVFAINHPRLAADKNGNIYMTSNKTSSFVVIKISPEGDMMWDYLYPGVSNPGCEVWAMALDKEKNVYLTGGAIGPICPGGNVDYLTIKISQDKVGVDPNYEIISDYQLFQNYPNPFNPITTIKFSIPKSEFVILKIFDLLGKEIETLVSEQKSAGTHIINWKADGVSSGVYYYRLIVGDFEQTRKLILLR